MLVHSYANIVVQLTQTLGFIVTLVRIQIRDYVIV